MSAQEFHGFTDEDVISALRAASARSHDGWALAREFVSEVPTTQPYMDGASLTLTLRRLVSLGRVSRKGFGKHGGFRYRPGPGARARPEREDG